jgi:hypothetical protein
MAVDRYVAVLVVVVLDQHQLQTQLIMVMPEVEQTRILQVQAQVPVRPVEIRVHLVRQGLLTLVVLVAAEEGLAVE